ncbi:MAG: glycosyltransferase [Actinomycetota bacterium]|nr:glycosyltransferase [Actinomycetota bacterium]
MTPRVSLLIPNRNNEPALDLVFERLAEHTTYPDVEVVVVDDGSTDRSREILRRWRDSGRFERFVYEEQENSGVVVTLNKCLDRATGEICVQLDADATIETPQWLEKMLAFFLTDDRIGVVSPKVVFDSGVVHAFGVSIVGPEGLHDRGTRLLEPAGRRTLHQNVERPKYEHAPYRDRIAEVDSGIGCCMMYRREDALAVGGYDMGFQPVWFDDLDLALSIRHQRAKKNFFLPDVFVMHRVGLRQTRGDGPSRREVGEARVGALLPEPVKASIKRRRGVPQPAPEALARLRHHYAYWQQKWGWDLINPDMAALRERYAGSEVLWAFDPGMRAEGERIAARHLHRQAVGDATAGIERSRTFLRRYGFLPPPEWASLTPFEHILDVIREHRLAEKGDFVEIGAFVGGGTYQLARLLQREAPGRKVVAIDVFAPAEDTTATTAGVAMADIYDAVLRDGDQRELYDAVLAGCGNVETVVGDSASVDIPTDAIAFAHVDGNHSAEYVRNDFEKVWAKTVPGGVVAFDDYGHDLPQVTDTVDRLREEHADEIGAFWTAGPKTAFVKRRERAA